MGFFIPNSFQILINCQSYLIHPYPSLGMLFINKLFNSIACLLYFINPVTGDTRENLDFAVFRQNRV